jgi:hypothetical protein
LFLQLNATPTLVTTSPLLKTNDSESLDYCYPLNEQDEQLERVEGSEKQKHPKSPLASFLSKLKSSSNKTGTRALDSKKDKK